LYYTYQKMYWCYKKMFRKHKRLDLAIKLVSVVLTITGAVVGGITLNQIILASVSGAGVFLQIVKTHKNFSK